MPKVWRIDSVVSVAWRVLADNDYRWEDHTPDNRGTAQTVYDMFAGKAVMPVIQDREILKACEILTDLADRERLTKADVALRGFLIECGRRGGVRLSDVARVATVAAYGLNGMGKRYPRRDNWEACANSQWQGTPGKIFRPNEPITVRITHTENLKTRQGVHSKTKKYYRYLGRLYMAVDDQGNVYKWKERQRTKPIWHDLTLGDVVTLESGIVDLHDVFTAKGHAPVRITEFTENGVKLGLPWYDAQTA